MVPVPAKAAPWQHFPAPASSPSTIVTDWDQQLPKKVLYFNMNFHEPYRDTCGILSQLSVNSNSMHNKEEGKVNL